MLFNNHLLLAQLRQSGAKLSTATVNRKRHQDLVAKRCISQRLFNDSVASLQAAQTKLALAQSVANVSKS